MEQLHPESFGSLRELLAQTLAPGGGLTAFLEEEGYAEITSAVRESESPDEYAEAVLRALDRRGLLDERLFAKLIDRLPDLSAELNRLAADMQIVIAETPDPLAVAEATEYPALNLPTGATSPGDDTLEASLVTDPGLTLPAWSAVLRAAESVVQMVSVDGFGMATGVLIAEDLVLVPDYISSEVGAGQARTEAADGRRLTVAMVEVVSSDNELGLGVCRLAEPLGPPIDLCENIPAKDDRLTIIHFPLGGSMRLGPALVLGSTAVSIAYSAATGPGSGGGALVDATGRLVGINHSRQFDTSLAVLASNCVKLLRRTPTLAAVLSTVADVPSLVSVDPALEAVFMGDDAGAQPVLVQLEQAGVDLDALDGVDVSSSLGRTVAATVTSDGLAALKEIPEVVSIDLSRNVGTRELFRSLPAIGMPVQQHPDEHGDACLVALIDDGVDVHHGAFVKDGTTKIEAYWDQTAPDQPCAGASPASQQLAVDLSLKYGRLFDRSDIDALRAAGTKDVPTPAADCTHGTRVAAIAAGSRCGEGVGSFPGGVAPEAPLLVVRFDPDLAVNGYENSHLDAFQFIGRMAERLGRPVVVNISSGVNSGGHDGLHAVETACAHFVAEPGRVIVKSAGNERNAKRHTQFILQTGTVHECEIVVPDADGSDYVEFWWPSRDQYRIVVVAPDNTTSGEISEKFPLLNEAIGGTRVDGDLRLRIQREDRQRSRLRITLAPPAGGRVRPGSWRFRFEGEQVRTREDVFGWIEIGPRDTRFTDPSTECTLTIPGTSRAVVCVGAIAPAMPITPWEGSSEGPSAAGFEKPDVVAPGVDIQSAAAGKAADVSVADSGTSFAAPHVTGAVALGLSAAVKLDPAKVPLANEVIGALREHRSDDFSQWNGRTGYGPLDVGKFLTLLATTVAQRET